MSKPYTLHVWPDGKMILEANEDVDQREMEEMRAVLEKARESFMAGKPLIVSSQFEVRPVVDPEIKSWTAA